MTVFDTIGNVLTTHKAEFLTGVVAVPIAIEACVFVHQAWTHRTAIKEKFYSCIEYAKNHPLKCLALAVAAAAVTAGAFAGAVYLFPIPLAVMVALSALYISAKLYHKRTEIKNKVVAAFTPQANETPEIARARIQKNILKTVAATVFITALAATAVYLVHSGILLSLIKSTTFGQELFDIFSKIGTGQWINFPPSFLSLINKSWFIVTTYALVTVAHLYKAGKHIENGERAKALFHIFFGLLTFTALPIMWSGVSEFRFHHFFYGALLALSDIRIVKLFGATAALDGALWWICSPRDWDFINLIVENLMAFATFVATLTIFQWLTDSVVESVSANSTDHSHTLTAPPSELTG